MAWHGVMATNKSNNNNISIVYTHICIEQNLHRHTTVKVLHFRFILDSVSSWYEYNRHCIRSVCVCVVCRMLDVGERFNQSINQNETALQNIHIYIYIHNFSLVGRWTFPFCMAYSKYTSHPSINKVMVIKSGMMPIRFSHVHHLPVNMNFQSFSQPTPFEFEVLYVCTCVYVCALYILYAMKCCCLKSPTQSTANKYVPHMRTSK